MRTILSPPMGRDGMTRCFPVRPTASPHGWFLGHQECQDDPGLRMASRRKDASKVSAGLLLFRRHATLELFLAHPGGPFWSRRDLGAWTIPKGMINPGENPFDAAQREFREETGMVPSGPFIELGSIRQKAGKEVFAWAWEGDADPSVIRSNLAKAEWPRGSGRYIQYPEIDRCAWFDPDEARRRLNPAQAEFVDRLEHLLGE